MPHKDLEQNRQYDRDYRKRPEIMKRDKEYDAKWQKERRHKQRELALKLIGEKCAICGSINRLCFHEKNGKLHNNKTSTSFYLSHSQDFITLCYYHHKLVHALRDMTDTELFKVFKLC